MGTAAPRTQALAFDEAAQAALEEAREAQALEVSHAREAVDRLSQDVAGTQRTFVH